MGLTGKQEAFCREYVVDYNGTQAAIRAGYSAKTARQMADENLSKPDIQKYLSELKADILEKVEIRAADVAQSDKDITEVSWLDVHEFDGYVPIAKHPDELTEIQKKAIRGVVQTGSKFTYILHDPDKAKERLMKFSGGFEKDNKQKNEKPNKLAEYINGLPDDQLDKILGIDNK